MLRDRATQRWYDREIGGRPDRRQKQGRCGAQLTGRSTWEPSGVFRRR